jgi:hypothetical protein
MVQRKILPFSKRFQLHYYHCHFLLQLIMIQLDSSPDDPVCALPACICLSEEHSIDPLHATAMSLLARMHFEMNNIKQARSVMKAAMPVLIQHGHVFFQGEAWLTLSKCRLSELKDLESEGGKDEMVKTHTRIGISTAELSNNKIRRSTLLKRCAKDLKHATDMFEMIV